MTSHSPKYNAERQIGFTLVELLVAIAGSSLLLIAALSLIGSQLEITKRAARLEDVRTQWNNAISFISSEMAFSERIFTSSSQINIPSVCNFSSSEVRFALDIRKDLPLAIYAVKPSGTRLLADNALWRCGPAISSDGAYIGNQISLGVVADRLSSTATGGGFSITVPTGSAFKFASEISLSFKGSQTTGFNFSSSGFARINPLFLLPNDVSSCILANNFALMGTSTSNSLTLSSPGLICGEGGGDTINGSSGDDILEAGNTGGATINGNGGNDILRGTNNADTIAGGAGNDILIGRDGDDQLSGGLGTNQYLPGDGNDQITGNAAGLDVVFLPSARSSYSISGCTKVSCTISSATEGTKTLSNVNVIVFPDARLDLP